MVRLAADLEISSGIHRKEILRTIAHLVQSSAHPTDAAAGFAPYVPTAPPSPVAHGQEQYVLAQQRRQQLLQHQGQEEQEQEQEPSKSPPLQASAVPVLFPDGDSATYE